MRVALMRFSVPNTCVPVSVSANNLLEEMLQSYLLFTA